ncbi:MAG: hypothetical protein M3R49_08940 [Chloroflexota bacterium]|nr:hypothetical protein [Chloroflexota bacterium]
MEWDGLGPSLSRLDEFAGGGGGLAGTVAAAIREEEVAALGRSAGHARPARALGYAGISELLRFRPPSRASAAAGKGSWL